MGSGEGIKGMMVRVGNNVNQRMRHETERALLAVSKYSEASTNIEGKPFPMEPKDFFVMAAYIRTFAKTCGLL